MLEARPPCLRGELGAVFMQLRGGHSLADSAARPAPALTQEPPPSMYTLRHAHSRVHTVVNTHVPTQTHADTGRYTEATCTHHHRCTAHGMHLHTHRNAHVSVWPGTWGTLSQEEVHLQLNLAPWLPPSILLCRVHPQPVTQPMCAQCSHMEHAPEWQSGRADDRDTFP